MKQIIIRNEPNTPDSILLTPRELQIVQLVADGLTNHEIGEKMQLSAGTVEVYRSKIVDKSECKTITHLVAVCFRQKLIS